MRKNAMMGLIASALLVFSTSASALELSASFNFANSNLVNMPTDLVADANGNFNLMNLDLTPGDIIALDITVGNAPGDLLEAIFTSITYDRTKLSFLGGAYNNILTEDSCVGFLCSPATLSPGIPNPILKPNQPSALGTGTESWVQATAHTNTDGSAGTGPDVALLMAFSYIGAGGFDFVRMGSELTSGDAIGPVGAVTGPIVFSSAIINVPEPGTALLMGLGLFGLGAAGRRKNRVVLEATCDRHARRRVPIVG